MAELQAEAAAATPEPVTIVETPKPTIEQTMEKVYEKNYPDSRVTRNAESGEFKSKEPAKAEEKTEGAETSDSKITQEPTTETVEPETTPAIDMPASWASDRKGIWDTLSPEARQLIADRESQAQSKISELGRAVKATENVKPYLEPLERLAQQRGVPTGEAIQRFMQADEFLNRDPAAAIQWLAQSYRVDLSRLVQPPLAGDTPESAHINALTQHISRLERQLADTANRITSREQAETQAREQSLTASVEKFAEGKDYWPEIEDEVYHQILAMKSADPKKVLADPLDALKKAEERAVKLTPKVQEKLEKAAKEKAEAEKKAEDKRKADEARKLASINVKSATGATPKAASKSIEAEMSEIYDRMAG